jgi:ketosteroid isomerase-like protein
MSNSDTVKAIYAAFGRGDVDFIINRLADDVEWDTYRDNYGQRAGVPHLQFRKGPEAVREFFDDVAKIGITRFDVLSVLEGGNQVAAEIDWDGAKMSEEEMHLWTFDDAGKVTRYRHYADTAKHAANYGTASGSARA